MEKRGQFSVEFLLTYGWVFFIVFAGVAVIYSTGILSFSDFLPEKCDFLGQIRCTDSQIVASAPGSGTFRVKVANDFGVDLVIFNATLRDASNLACAGTSNSYVPWLADSVVEVNVTGCVGTKINSRARFDGDMLLIYYRNNSWCNNPPTNCLYTSVGQLVIKIT